MFAFSILEVRGYFPLSFYNAIRCCQNIFTGAMTKKHSCTGIRDIRAGIYASLIITSAFSGQPSEHMPQV